MAELLEWVGVRFGCKYLWRVTITTSSAIKTSNGKISMSEFLLFLLSDKIHHKYFLDHFLLDHLLHLIIFPTILCGKQFLITFHDFFYLIQP